MSGSGDAGIQRERGDVAGSCINSGLLINAPVLQPRRKGIRLVGWRVTTILAVLSIDRDAGTKHIPCTSLCNDNMGLLQYISCRFCASLNVAFSEK